ncbi:Hypothetical protein SRAE_X000047500 [Strongyloides ratti]|uniref:Uncharacterized protein n=1 Tax=Strongyloides ratti TaxID=34506 RepID=A0A090N0R5_STRRB|nr:Hypothetical protein SRAE_X000047500 [Strongyloides ratti]CEF71148.1 Hypothetical protein SRAE_X000047500 [Strongyloides ratti]
MTSSSSKISSQVSTFEKRAKIKNGSNNKKISSENLLKSISTLPKIDINNKKAKNNDIIKQWGRAERRLTLVSFPKIWNERKKRNKIEEETQAYEERQKKFIKSFENIPESNIIIDNSNNYFNIFFPLNFISNECIIESSTNELSSSENCIDSKNYMTSFQEFYNIYKIIENKRDQFFDNYNINIIRRRQLLELQKKIKKNETITKTFLDIENNLNEEELINNFNIMTNQFAALTFKLCHFASIKEKNNIKSITKDNWIIKNVINIENESEKEIDLQLRDVDYQINEINNDINKIIKLLNE